MKRRGKNGDGRREEKRKVRKGDKRREVAKIEKKEAA